jgi:hypothetical protein
MPEPDSLIDRLAKRVSDYADKLEKPDLADNAGEAESVPRIRGDNPPAASREELLRLHQNARVASAVLYIPFALICAGAILGKLIGYDYSTKEAVLLLGCALIFFFGAIKAHEYFTQQAEPSRAMLSLDVYNTEFTSLLADNSLLRTTIHFEMPSVLARATSGQSSYHVEQLNRVTETILLRFAAAKATPPTAQEIENHLETNLVQFQNEKQIAVLRLKVATNIHILPDKPKGIHV